MKIKIMLLVLSIVVIVCYYISAAILSVDKTASIINLTVLFVMVMFMSFGMIGLLKLNQFNHSIENYKKTGKDDKLSKTLTDTIAQFEKDRGKIKNSEINLSIDNYINEELYRRTANADFNEFIPNALTGIGILGTFFGLTLGLKNFDAQTADTMYGSITPLIDGIKVAFYTSILGVSLSVIYSLIIKILFRQSDSLINDLYASHNDKFTFNSEAQTLNLILDAMTTDLPLTILYNLPQRIAAELEPKMQKNIQKLERSFTDNFIKFQNESSSQLNDNVMLLAEKLEKNVLDMGKILSQNIVALQNNGIKQLMNEFCDKMNDLLNADFQNLKTAIEGIASWEQTLSSDLQKWVPAMTNSIQKLAENHKDWNDISVRIENLTAECKEQREALSKQLEFISNQKDLITEQAVAYFASFREMNQIVQETAQNIILLENDLNEAYRGQLLTLQTIQKSVEQNSVQFQNHVKDAFQNIENASVKLSQSCELMENTTTKQLALVSEQHINTFEQIESMIGKSYEQIESASESLSKSFEHFGILLDNASEQLRQRTNQDTNSLEMTAQAADLVQINPERIDNNNDNESAFSPVIIINQDIKESEQYDNTSDSLILFNEKEFG